MLNPDHLNVWYDQRLVGLLWRNPQGMIGFRYDSHWLAQGGFAISRTLPLREDEFGPEEYIAHRYFANLLPEGNVRDQIVRNLKIANTDFNLLRSIGGECAGALSILQVEDEPSTEFEYTKLSSDDLANLVARRGQAYTIHTDERPRFSLAGAQDKCPVLVENDVCWLPRRESPTSHILKFELSDYRHVPAYETFTTMLARAIGLPVVEIELRSIEDTHYVLIERYDRQKVQNLITRLHQEDFCQALGFGHEHKYQEDGGPTFADCIQLIRDVSRDPAHDLLYLLRWQIFNVLAGNSDGHAKNLSLLYQPDGEIRLAPFYDLVCTRAIERIDYNLAFFVGDVRNPGIVTLKHWDALALQCDLRTTFLHNQIQDVAINLLQQLQPTRETFESLYGGFAALQRIERIVTKQCKRIIRELQ